MNRAVKSKTPAPTSPEKLIPIDYLPLRLGEVAAFFAGQANEAICPRWVRRLGRELAHVALPCDWCQSGDAAPKEFFGGILEGMALRISTEGVSRIFGGDTERLRLDRLSQEIKHPDLNGIDLRTALAEVEAGKHRDDVTKAVTESLSLASQKRYAFFHGFLLGLDMDRAIDVGMAAMKRKSKGKKVFNYLKFYLWLCWPEIEKQGSIPALFDHCARAFRTTENPHVTGTEDSFRRYCNRIGLSFRSPDS